MYQNRLDIMTQIENNRGSKVILYSTSSRMNMQTNIAGDVIDLFAEHLEKLESPAKITLILHTLGGSTLAAWNLVNMIREYCDYLEIIVLNKARSAGTLISLGANKIIMNNQSTLGPIDPSLTTPLNPIEPQTNPKRLIPVSVESVKGYVDFAKEELNIKAGKNFKEIYRTLSEKVHPIVIGGVYRSKVQIQMLAKKLLNLHFPKKKIIKRQRIVKFLCSDSGSHDYTINKTEATQLGLPIEYANAELNDLMCQLYKDLKLDLQLDSPYNPVKYLGSSTSKAYNFVRGVIESNFGHVHQFISKGTLSILSTPNGINKLNDNRDIDEWSKIQ